MLTSEAIVSCITQYPVGEAKDDADDVGEPLANVSSQQVYSFLNIKAFLLCTMSSSNADQAYHLLKDLEMELAKEHFNACTHQTTILDFFIR